MGAEPLSPRSPRFTVVQSRRTRQTFGEYLDALMRDYGATNYYVGKVSGFVPSYISRLRTGDRVPTREIIERIAAGMDVTSNERKRMLLLSGFAPDELIDTLLALLTTEGQP